MLNLLCRLLPGAQLLGFEAMLIPVQFRPKISDFLCYQLVSAFAAGGWRSVLRQEIQKTPRFGLLDIPKGFLRFGRRVCEAELYKAFIDFDSILHEGNFEFVPAKSAP